MSIDLDHLLVETATKIAITTNADGDINYGATTSSACLYRDISTLNQAVNREDVTIDGLLWFGASENVIKGDVYYHPDEGYLRIHRIVNAKTLVTDNVHKFIKCEVLKMRQVS